MLGEAASAPTFCEEMEALAYAGERQMTVVRLALLREFSGLVLIGGGDVGSPSATQQPLVELVATQAATVLSLIGAREQSHRGAMKDPASSAYTFAYFVDVAGREIAMARRHGRRFSLATVGLELAPDSGVGDETEPTVFGAERVLGAVRDTDVLARVDANEFYLLLARDGRPGCARLSAPDFGAARRSDGDVAVQRGRRCGDFSARRLGSFATFAGREVPRRRQPQLGRAHAGARYVAARAAGGRLAGHRARRAGAKARPARDAALH